MLCPLILFNFQVFNILFLIVFPPFDRRRPQRCPRCSALRCGLDPRWASQPGPSPKTPLLPQRTEG